MRIGVDLMGADTAPASLFEGLMAAANSLAGRHKLVVFASPEFIKSVVLKGPHSSIEYVPCNEVIQMEDEPVLAVKQKGGASLVLGIRSLADSSIDAFVTCGNTGALVTAAVLFLKKFPKILRPALIATLPSEKGPVVVLDVGGSTACKARHLVQFGQLGAAYQSVMHQRKKPVVGLLNIGIESKKGRDEIRDAYEKLSLLASKSNHMIFVGNVEGRDLFKGDVDVIVTDGFTGNVLLKTAEGTAAFVFDILGDASTLELSRKLCEEQQSGALLCGVEKTVIKVHGNSSPKDLHRAILKAASCVQSDCTVRMKQLITREGSL